MMASCKFYSSPRHLHTLLFLFLVAPNLILVAGAGAGANKSCNNNPDNEEVFVKYWVNGAEKEKIIGLEAKFGSHSPKDASKALKRAATLAHPLNGCTSSTLKFSDSVILAKRGDCSYTEKAKVAESGGAAGLLVINENEDLTEMVCAENDSSLDIKIPVLMISKSEGERIIKSLTSGESVDVLLYSPDRPIVEFSVFFLWLMAVVTIVISSLWAGADARNQMDPSDYGIKNEYSEDEIVEVKASGAIVFLVMASTVLLLLYFFMSKIAMFVVVVLFCIGGASGTHTCVVALISRIFKGCGQIKYDLPVLGESPILSIIVLPLCLAFAFFWASHQDASYGWLCQNILGMCLMMSALRVVRLPNIKVASALLCCAFFYDIFWVFISPLIFKKSVMVEVARSKDTSGQALPMTLTIPRFFDPWGGTSILGFGDVMIPGLLVTFSYRFDKLTKKSNLNGYFIWMLVGYTAGVGITYLSLYLMNGRGQPALLYLVPCTLGLIVILGCVRREMRKLWIGPEESHSYSDEEC